VFFITSTKPVAPFVQTSLLYKPTLMHPSQTAAISKRHAKAQYLSPELQWVIPFPQSPIEKVWQMGAHTVQQHAPH